MTIDFPLLFTAFGALFLMELGDKTQLAVLSLTARTSKPLAVFAGSALALLAVTLLAVIVGALAGEFIPLAWVSRLAGVLFLAIGVWMLWSARPGAAAEEDEEEVDTTKVSRGQSSWRVFAVSFGLLAAAEMGDKTQLTVFGLTAKEGDPLSVFVGAGAALTLITLIAALVGQTVARFVPVRWVSRAAGTLFVVLGALTLAGVF